VAAHPIGDDVQAEKIISQIGILVDLSVPTDVGGAEGSNLSIRRHIWYEAYVIGRRTKIDFVVWAARAVLAAFGLEVLLHFAELY
jgi:hypothetical protein